MNIGIDARGVHGNKAGIAIYIEEIIKRINSKEEKKDRYILYSNKDIEINANLKDNIIIKKQETRMPGTFWLYFKLPKILKEDQIDVFWGTQHMLPKRNKYTKNIKFVLTIHDLAIKKLKTVGSLKNTLIQKLFLGKSIKNADKFVAISEATKNDIMELFKINEEKIKVVYNGSNIDMSANINEDEAKNIRKKFKIEDENPYIFFISTIEPRKNVETLIKAFDYIKSTEKSNLKLILAGGLGWKYDEALKLYETSKYKNDIIMPRIY
ncbi:MAG: glycosyltransferase family 4 protein [Clostridia bacterium]|jgi:glycosyltransferase involved in cell wall biosynthesis|nr:glycosyltransferase family 4 protein [Clostridia bacterium]